MQKNIVLALAYFLFLGSVFAQETENLPEFRIEKSEVEANLRYLASDELKGRDTGSPGGDSAAVFIARQFEQYGLKQVEGADGWMQNVPFLQVIPPASGEMIFGKHKYTIGKNLLISSGHATEEQVFEAIFAGHGWINEETGQDDYENLDVKGKMVFVLPGDPDSSHPFSAFKAIDKKRKIAVEKGAVGLIELYRMNFPWGYFKQYMGGEKLTLDSGDDKVNNLIYGWLKEESTEAVAQLSEGETLNVKLNSPGVQSAKVSSANVIGMVEGTDPNLKEEYIVLTAHYDHVGVDKNAAEGQDSIYNGARDNGIGTVSLLAAAKAMAAHPPARPTIFLAFTAEEKGLQGSAYYVENPLIPLEKTVFNLNNDGGGYNSTDHVAIIGYGRTGTDAEIQESVKPVGLKVAENPMPEENLFDRSDNVNFAIKGVPAIDFAPGALSFSPEVTKYYHQVADEADSIDYDYLLKFCKSYAHAARLIANKKELPKWTEGDKYEAVGKQLYEK